MSFVFLFLNLRNLLYVIKNLIVSLRSEMMRMKLFLPKKFVIN